MSDLQCYCCGKPIPDSFALVTMSEWADRVFVMLKEHADRAQHSIVIPVKREAQS